MNEIERIADHELLHRVLNAPMPHKEYWEQPNWNDINDLLDAGETTHALQLARWLVATVKYREIITENGALGALSRLYQLL